MATTHRAVTRIKRKAKGRPATSKKVSRWSKHVNETSDALDLQSGIFKSRSSKTIARSLKRSAEQSARKKGSPYQSAMSMLTFYVNRGGKNLTPARKQTLARAKDELRTLFGRD